LIKFLLLPLHLAAGGHIFTYTYIMALRLELMLLLLGILFDVSDANSMYLSYYFKQHW